MTILAPRSAQGEQHDPKAPDAVSRPGGCANWWSSSPILLRGGFPNQGVIALEKGD